MLTLYSWRPVGHSLKVLIALAEKGLGFRHDVVDVLGLDDPWPALGGVARSRSLPVLVDGTVALSESSIINEYLNETRPDVDLMPGGRVEHWRARSWFKFVNEDLAPAVGLLAWTQWTLPALSAEQRRGLGSRAQTDPAPERGLFWQRALAGFDLETLEAAADKIDVFLDAMTARLQVGDYLAGDAYSLADIDVWPFLEPLPRLKPALFADSGRQAVLDWIRRVGQRPAVRSALAGGRDQDWLPGPEPIRWG